MRQDAPEMTTQDVIEIVQLFNQHHIDICLDGGWGVDALIEKQTRPHADLDIAVQHKDVARIRALLEARGYTDVPRDDTRECNFVLGDDQGHQIDIHSYTFDATGNLVYGIAYPFDSLNGTGTVNGHPVKCITPEWMVKFHTGYKLDENDYRDVQALCQHFGIEMPSDYKEFVSEHSIEGPHPNDEAIAKRDLRRETEPRKILKITMMTYDAIIIGGGIAGVSLAFHLAQRGMRLVVLERDFIAAHATGRSSGLVRMHYDLEAESRLAWISFDYFRNWRERVGGECGFTRTGFVYIVPPTLNAQLRANIAMHQRIGIPSLLVTADDVKRLAPSFVTDDFELAAYEPESGYADPSATAAAFMTAARERGAHLMQSCRVTAIRVSHGRVTGVVTDRGEFAAPVIVNAAGAWAADVGRMVGLELPLTTWTHEVLFVRRPPPVPPHPTVIDDALSMYLRPETGGLTLVALEDDGRYDESPDEERESISQDSVNNIVERLCRRVPAMEGGSFKTAHAGHDGLTPDQRPILGQAGPDGFYLACGFSGTGFKIGPAVGACLAELIVEGRAATADISPFTLRRFERGELLQGEHAYAPWR